MELASTNINLNQKLHNKYLYMAKTLFDKIWEKHVVKSIPDGPSVLYIDKHFIHEVTSPRLLTELKKGD